MWKGESLRVKQIDMKGGKEKICYQTWILSKENAADWWKKERQDWKWTKKSPKKTDLGISESWEVMGNDFEKYQEGWDEWK